jgi:hypothetical protein
LRLGLRVGQIGRYFALPYGNPILGKGTEIRIGKSLSAGRAACSCVVVPGLTAGPPFFVTFIHAVVIPQSRGQILSIAADQPYSRYESAAIAGYGLSCYRVMTSRCWSYHVAS